MLGKKTSMGSFIPPLNMDILGTSGTNGTTTPNASTKNYKVETGSSPKTVSNKSSNLVRIKTIKGSITHRGSSSFKFPEDSPDRINHKLSLTPNTPKTDGPKFVYQMKQAVSKGSALSPKKTLSTSSSVASKDFLNPGNVEVQPKKPNPPNTRKGSKV